MSDMVLSPRICSHPPLPGLTRQSIFLEQEALFRWMRGSSPRMTIPRISGGSLTFAISQNFFVGGETTTAFYGKATQEKE
jgi:hypothetical protein